MIQPVEQLAPALAGMYVYILLIILNQIMIIFCDLVVNKFKVRSNCEKSEVRETRRAFPKHWFFCPSRRSPNTALASLNFQIVL